MSPTVLLVLLGVGLAVGFLSGLVGIGGGVLIVPFLYFFYAHPSWSGAAVPPSLQAVTAHATSLFIIVPTSALGAWTYHRASLVAWRAALPIALASAVAAVVGARLALLFPAEALKLAFGVLLVWAGLRMFRRDDDAGAPSPRVSVGLTVLAGGAIGLLSALLGVGGGVIAIPILAHLVGLELPKVAATSIAIIAFTAAAGVLTYMTSGGAADMPPGTVGLVHLGAALPILVGSLVAVRWGAAANQRLGTAGLRLLFGLLFLVLGARLVVVNLLAMR